MFAADGQVIDLKKRIWRYRDIVRKLLNREPLTADEKAFLRKEGTEERRWPMRRSSCQQGGGQ